MGWGTDFTADIFLNRLSFTHPSELDDKIEELEYSIEENKKELAMYAVSNIKDVVPDEWQEDAVIFIRKRIAELTDQMLDDQRVLTDLLHYKNHKVNNS